MPGDWDVVSQAPGKPAGAWDVVEAKPTAQPSRFMQGAARVAEGISSVVQAGRGFAHNLGADAYGLTEFAGPLGMAAHYAAEKTGLGSKIRSATENRTSMEKAGGYAETAASILMPIGGKGKALTVARDLENVNNPAVERSLQSVEKEVRMTPGQRSGQRAVQTAERDLLNKPVSSTEAHEFYAGQQEDIAKAARSRATQQGGQVTNPYGAGSAVHERLQQRITQLKSYADKLYDSTRKTTARNVQEVQTGVRDVPASTILDEHGQPMAPARQEAVMEKLETPVALDPIRGSLKSVYEDLTRSLPEARRANSPAFRALDELMKSNTKQMSAMDFDKFLSAVKSITRDGTSQYLTTQSQGLAKQVIRAGEQGFQSAIQGAGPNVADKLGRARKAVREYHDTADFLGDLNSEPAALYSNLVTGGDRVKNTLTYLDRTAPKAVQTVGRTFLEEMVDKATREGGWGRSAGVFADWNRLGPETKNLLFGPQVSKNLDEFLLAAKQLTPVVGSPTADRLSALTSYGDVGSALVAFLSGHPAVAGGLMFKSRVQPAILARLSFNPVGAQLLKQSLTLPVRSPGWIQAMKNLAVLANRAESSQSDDQPKNDRLGKPLPPQ